MFKVILISDYLLERDVYAHALSQNGGIDFVGCFDSINESIDFIYKHSVDLVLVDVKLTGTQLDALARLKDRFSTLKVLFMTEPDDTDLIIKIFSLGAAYVLKNHLLNEFVNIIITTLKGNMFICADAVSVLTELCRDKLQYRTNKLTSMLTDRELEILSCITKGMSNTEIGKSLYLSPLTVKNHVSRIIEKLAVKDRVQATAVAIKSGLV